MQAATELTHASKLEDKGPAIKVAVGQSRGKAVSDLAG